jgi:hypothetical protein
MTTNRRRRVPPGTRETLRETGEKAGPRAPRSRRRIDRVRSQTQQSRTANFCTPKPYRSAPRVSRDAPSGNCESPILRLLAELSKGLFHVVRKVCRSTSIGARELPDCIEVAASAVAKKNFLGNEEGAWKKCLRREMRTDTAKALREFTGFSREIRAARAKPAINSAASVQNADKPRAVPRFRSPYCDRR